MNSEIGIFDRLLEERWYEGGLDRLAWHVDQFGKQQNFDHSEGGKLPRNHQWRPYRFCVQDVVLGLTVIRHLRDVNCLEVDVFLTASIPEYEADSGVRGITLLMLSDAYKSGGSMEIRFTKNVEDGQVPKELVKLANAEEILFEQSPAGIITPSEAKQLYSALTGFSARLLKRIQFLEESGRISTPLTCYAIHHGLWDRVEVEAILLTCPNPGLLLSGQVVPEQRLLFTQALSYGRGALLLGSLDRHLRTRTHTLNKGAVHLEDDQRELEMTINGDAYLVTYRCPQESISIPWITTLPVPGNEEKGGQEISPNEPFSVLIRAREAADLAANLETDIQIAGRLWDIQNTGPVYVLVPRDFEKLPNTLRKELVGGRPEGVGFMMYRSYASALDEDVTRKLQTSGAMRS